jgi:hypothetical protein
VVPVVATPEKVVQKSEQHFVTSVPGNPIGTDATSRCHPVYLALNPL